MDRVLSCPVVSIIIPVHDPTVDELTAALRSALSQTYVNLELLIVDDGSSQKIASQIDAASCGDTRIRVVHKANGGVASARNCGLDIARGDLVAFLDADDTLDRCFVEHAVGVILAEDCDAVFGRIIVGYRDRTALWRSQPHATEGNVKLLKAASLGDVRGRILSAKVTEKEGACEYELTNVVGALYRSELLRGVRFRTGVSQSEDRIFNVDVLGRASSVAVVNSTWYFYDRRREMGATSRFTGRRVQELERTLEEFAILGGFVNDDPRVLPTEVRMQAAVGIVNHLKLASLAAGFEPSPASVSAVSGLLRSEAVQRVSRAVPGLHGLDYVVLLLARYQRAEILVALGCLYGLGARWKGVTRYCWERARTLLGGAALVRSSRDEW